MKKFFYLPLLFVMLLLACDTEEIVQLEEETQRTEPNFDLEAFAIDELPDIESEIGKLTEASKVGWASKNGGEGIVLDESSVLAVTDSVGNKTFSVRMYVPDTPYNVFHNLILKKTAKGKMNQPFILRYEVREDYWPTYISSKREDAPFQGAIKVYSAQAMFSPDSKNSKAREPIPCPYLIPVGNTNGSGSSGSSGGGSSSGSGNEGTGGGFTSVGIVWSKTPSGGGRVEVGKGYFGVPRPDKGATKKSGSARSSGECPEDELLVPINEEDFKNPCKQMKQAESDNTLKSKLKELQGKVKDNKEFGRLITGTNPTRFSNFLVGKPNEAGINFQTSAKIDGYLHSHYNGLLPVFSGNDIKAIYDLHKGENIRNTKTFTAYLVTSGTTYALKIDDISDFLNFGNRFLSSKNKFQGFEAIYSESVKLTNTSSQNELAFANLIKGSGLKLFKGNPITFGTWTAITSNNARTGIINDDCN